MLVSVVVFVPHDLLSAAPRPRCEIDMHTEATKIPGLAPSMHDRINADARRFLTHAVLRGDRPSSLFVHLEPEGVTVVYRRDLARRFDDADVPQLARRVRMTPTPRGSVLVLVDTEATTEIVSVPLASLGLRGGWGR